MRRVRQWRGSWRLQLSLHAFTLFPTSNLAYAHMEQSAGADRTQSLSLKADLWWRMPSRNRKMPGSSQE